MGDFGILLVRIDFDLFADFMIDIFGPCFLRTERTRWTGFH